MMHLVIHVVHTSVMPYVSLDQYFNPNLYTIPNMQKYAFLLLFSIYLCRVYLKNPPKYFRFISKSAFRYSGIFCEMHVLLLLVYLGFAILRT